MRALCWVNINKAAEADGVPGRCAEVLRWPTTAAMFPFTFKSISLLQIRVTTWLLRMVVKLKEKNNIKHRRKELDYNKASEKLVEIYWRDYHDYKWLEIWDTFHIRQSKPHFLFIEAQHSSMGNQGETTKSKHQGDCGEKTRIHMQISVYRD